ncbi:MAG: LCP family protein [Oscillospiraceae bacterium]|jgi:LCP family protein required for cell wall assembly|nr:LCP family protein [Oscillospiraceae bacterium]
MGKAKIPSEKALMEIKKLKIKTTVAVVGFSALIILLVLLLFIVNNAMRAYNAIGTIDYNPQTVTLTEEEIEQVKQLDVDETLSNSDTADVTTAESEMDEFLAAEIPHTVAYDDIINVLLIGTDKKDEDEISRSDSMMLLTIDKKAGKIKLTSFMRDMYISIPGYGYDKLNSAFAYGGGELLLQTINKNLKVNIEKYACIDFSLFASLIDDLGGLYLDVKPNYLQQINKYAGKNHQVEKAGLQHLDGRQVLAFCRIRKIDSDVQRTERQRMVMKGIFAKVKSASLTELTDMVTKSMPQVRTNLTEDEIKDLMFLLPSVRNYDINEMRVPIDGTWSDLVINKIWYVDFNRQTNAKALGEFISG